MTLSAKGISGKMIRIKLRIPPLSWFSLRGIRWMAMGLTGCLILTFILFWHPSYLKFQSLQKEKGYWQSLISTEPANKKSRPGPSVIPSIDQLPEMIEECCRTFVQNGVDAVAFNVERFGESQQTVQQDMDYALVRLRLRGPWQGVESGLKALEESQEICIHVQEVNLVSGGGETLLQIYFSSGESES